MPTEKWRSRANMHSIGGNDAECGTAEDSAGPPSVRLLTDGGEDQNTDEESSNQETEDEDAVNEEGGAEASQEGEEGEEDQEGDEGQEGEEAEEGQEGEEGEEGGEGEEGQEAEEQEAEEGQEGEEAEEGQEGEGEEEEGATVLFLDLDGLFLNLLGLEVDLSEVILDVSAVPGDNRLLGNLLSAVAGLLDGGGLDDVFDNLLGGSLLGSLMGGGDGEDESNSMFSGAGEKIRNELGDIVDDLPLEELLTNFFKELISQLFRDTSDSSSSNSSEGNEAQS